MKAGDRIKVQYYICGTAAYWEEHTVEEFRYCLGFFRSEDARTANNFTPLCELYAPGPESEHKYLSNYGEYYTNPVQSWADIPRPTQEPK